jgi:hypothetical protein
MDSFIILLAEFTIGFFAINAAAKRSRKCLALSLGLPVGLLVTNVVTLAVFTTGTTYRPDIIIATLLLISLLWLNFTIKYDTTRQLPHIAGILAGAGGILYLLSSLDLAIFSYDSTRQILTARMIGMRGVFEPISVTEFSSWGSFLVLSHAPAGYFGKDFFPMLHPAMALSFFLFFTQTSFHFLGQAIPTTKKRTIIAIAVSLAVFSTYFMLFHSFYVHNNLMTSFFLFMSVVALHQVKVNTEFVWKFVATCALLGTCFLRTEAPLYAAIIIGAAWLWRRIPTITIRQITAIVAIPVIAWYIFLIVNMGQEGVILSPVKAMMAVAPLSILLLAMFTLNDGHVDLLRKPSVLFTAVMAMTIMGALFAAKPDHMARSFMVILHNLHNHGRWGIGWHVATALAIVTFCFRPVKKDHHWIFGVLALSGWLILSLSFFRTPYRIGWGDSANRMFVHLYPLAYFWVLLNFAAGGKISVRTQSREAI